MSDDKMREIKTRAVAGTLWNFLSNILTKLASMVVQLVLARLLLPEEFGTIAILNVFINISHVLITTGFATAIIQKKDLTETDKSSAYYMGLSISILLYVIIFISAPYIAEFYKMPELVSILRIYSIVIVIGALHSVHNSLINKEFKFKIIMIKSIIVVISQGVIGIALAFMNFGVWSLVISYIMGTIIGTAYICFTVKWHPKLLFSWKSVKEMFKFSSNVMISSVFRTVYSDIRALIIGRVYSRETLAFYDRANVIRGYVFDTTIGAVSTVALPVLSKVNDDIVKVKNGIRRIIRLNMYIGTPMRAGLILVAEPLILFLLTEKWAASISFLQLICITNLLSPCMYRTNAYLAIGRSDLALRCEVFNKVIILLCMFATINISVYMVVLSAMVGNVLSFITGLFVNKKHLNYTIKEQFLDILPSITYSLLMSVPVFMISLINLPVLVQLLAQVLVGSAIYLLMSALTKQESFYYLLSIIKDLISKKKEKVNGK